MGFAATRIMFLFLLKKTELSVGGEAAPGKSEQADSPEKVIQELERLASTGLDSFEYL